MYKPVFLGGIFKATCNPGPAKIAVKVSYMLTDLQRCAKVFGVPFAPNPHFPFNTLPLQRGAVAFLNTDGFDAYMDAVFNAAWVNQRNLNDVDEIGRILAEAGFDPKDVMGRIGAPDVKGQLTQYTDEAISRGAFGVPTFFVGDEMFFGQDRLDFVLEAARTG